MCLSRSSRCVPLTAIARSPSALWSGQAGTGGQVLRNAQAATKSQVTLRLDRDVLEFFRKDGQRYQTRINAALRAFVEHQRKRA